MADFLPMFAFIPMILLCCRMSHSLSDSWPPTNSTPQVKYVTPSKSIPCGINGHLNFPCLTIADFANEAETFFVNDSTFLFSPGNHILDITLNLTGIHNMSLIGLPNKRANIKVTNMLAGIICECCQNIEIFNINFNVASNFAYILSFESTYSVKLSNITILGNEHAGCSSIVCEKSEVEISNSKFVGIIGYSGAALITLESTITFAGFNCFSTNTARLGGAMSLHNSTVLFSGSNSFAGNSANNPSSFDTSCQKMSTFGEITGLGGAIFCNNSNLTNGEHSITNVTASVCESDFNISSTSRCIEENYNHVINESLQPRSPTFSSLSRMQCLSMLFLNNLARLGGALYITRSSIKICGSVSLVQNHAFFGGAIHTSRSNISFGKNCSTMNLSCTKAISELFFSHDVKCSATDLIGSTYICKRFIVFCSNTANGYGGAIGSHDSHLYLGGFVQFYNNSANYGGAMMLHGISKLILNPSLTIHFIQNSASQKGGVIYYHFSASSCHCSASYDECFIAFETSLMNISLIFVNNNASKAGSVLYGGALGSCDLIYGKKCATTFTKCKVKVDHDYRSHTDLYSAFKYVSDVSKQDASSALSSDANGIKLCSVKPDPFDHDIINPGKLFNIALVAFGQANFSVSTRISTKILGSSNNVDNFDLEQIKPLSWVSNSCTNVSFRLLATNLASIVTVNFKLYYENPCGKTVGGLDLWIYVEPCPLGFQLSSEYRMCKCDERLRSFTNTCYIDNLSIQRNKNTFWVSKDRELIFHKHGCPFDFCKDELINVSLSNSDVQCDFNRCGTLCGQCKEIYSLALGTLHCIKCTNSNYIAMIIPFALAGIVLVIVILFLHLTVDVGTLNGLIFYVNIVHSNRHTFVPHYRASGSKILIVFIAWFNLDFGFETCFYNGMDIYTYSWLQFVFPFYIWFLIGAIIFVSRYSKRVSKCLGQNPVAALATLLFVSYGKILNAIITPLSLTHLTLYSSDDSSSTHSVWLYDGSIDYFKDTKHIVLGLFAISILLVVFLPYTFLLLCGHWLMAYSDKCFLSWLNRIKPFMDVYYAPFKKEGRYWIGLILLSRLALLLTIAVNAVGSDSVNILVIASVTAGLLFIKRRVYENNYIDLLESSFIFNLCILSIATFYLTDKSPQIQYAVSTVSIVISSVTFFGILFFHVYLLLKSTNTWHRYKAKLLCKRLPSRDAENVLLGGNDPDVVTTSLVELREPLLDSDDS